MVCAQNVRKWLIERKLFILCVNNVDFGSVIQNIFIIKDNTYNVLFNIAALIGEN